MIKRSSTEFKRRFKSYCAASLRKLLNIFPGDKSIISRVAPYKDFKGQSLYEGDFIIHPDGDSGQIVYIHNGKNPWDKWRVDYFDGGCTSSLLLQVGDKGQAIKLEVVNEIYRSV